MKEIILKLLEQGKTKTEICTQLEITTQDFQKYLLVAEPKQQIQQTEKVTINYTENQKSKSIGDNVVDVVKISAGVLTGGLLLGMFDDD